MAKGSIIFTDELFGQNNDILTTEQLFGSQKDILTTDELFKPETEIRAIREGELFKPAPFKPKPIGYTITGIGKEQKEGIDPFTVMGEVARKHPLIIPMGITAPAFTATSLALSKLPRASQFFKPLIEKLPETEEFTSSDLGFVGQQSLRQMRGEPEKVTRYPRQEISTLLDSAQVVSEYLISGKAESLASRKLLENALKVLGGKLTEAGYGVGRVEIPQETITKIGNYTPSGQSLLLNLRARKIKIPARPPVGVTEKAAEDVSKAITPFISNVQPLPKPIMPTAPIVPLEAKRPEILTSEELFKQVPEDLERIKMEKTIDKYMANEPGKSNLYSIIKAEGGISPYSKTTAGGLKEEYRENLPLVLRRKEGLPLDEMAYALAERYPHLGITDESSLLEALGKEKALRQQPGAGGVVHIFPQKLTEKGIAVVGRDNVVRITQDTDATDIYGNKVKLPKGEEYTPYKLSNQQILLQDGEQIVINKNQFQNIKGQNIELGEKFAPELGQVEVVEKGGRGGISIDPEQTQQAIDRYTTLGQQAQAKKDPQSEYFFQRAEELTRQLENQEIPKVGDVKFAKYQLPGGENYREVLIKAPLDKNVITSFDEWIVRQPWYSTWKAEGADFTKAKDLFNQWLKRKNYGKGFTSSHWDEPNVLAHLRLNDRTTPDGKKVLFIEEIQSDWAREAREKGVRSDELKKEYENTVDKVIKDYNLSYGESIVGNPKIPQNIQEDISGKAIKWDRMLSTSHPLLKNWQELALKETIKKAVDGGYDYISWTTGEQQAERYDLSKQVDEILWAKSRDSGNVDITAYKDGKEVVSKDNLLPKELENLLGKDIAKKINDNEGLETTKGKYSNGTLKGKQLKIGGEWAKNLYDRQIPNILKDLTKGDITTVNLSKEVPLYKQGLTADELAVYKKGGKMIQSALKITPEIKTKVIGQPIAGGMVHREPQYFYNKEKRKGREGQLNIEILTTPFRAIAEKLDAVQYQVKHPISKAIVNDIQYVNIRAHRGAAEWLMRVDYFRGLKKEYDTLLTDLMENKHIDLPKEEFNKLFVLKQKLRKSLEEAWQKANAAGVKVKITDEEGTHWRPIGKIENYVPREIHPDIREQLQGGLKQLYEKMLELRDRGVKQNVKQAILAGKKSTNTYIVRLLKWLEEKEMKASASTLVRLIDKLINRDYIASYGHLERPRLIEDALPPEFYERRASVLFTRYFASAARRIAEIERFGQTNEKLLKRLRFVERVNPQEGRILRDLLKTYQDKTKHEIANTLASVISTVKIGPGTSTIPNITQTLISTIPKQGVFNFLKGAFNLIVDPQTKLFVKKTGLPYTDVVRGIVGYENYGLLGRVNDLLLTANGFKGVNRLNAMLTASSTERWVKKVLLPATQSTFKIRKQWAIDNLAKLKIYPKDIKEGKVSDEKLIDAMFITASNYQLFSDITNEPLFLSKPENRWLTVLKRFGYKQPLLIMHEILYDELKHANPIPLLRLIAGGILGGVFVIWANRKIYDTISWAKEKVTGETREPPDWYSKWDDNDRSIMDKAIDLMAQAGTVGMLSDITRVDSHNKWSLSRQLDFQLTPVVISEAIQAGSIVDILTKGEKKVGKRTVFIEPKERLKKAGEKVLMQFPVTKFFMEKE